MGGYKDLDIYKKAYDLAMLVHGATLKLPRFELYEQGSQLRRSSQSIKNNISEGYGRRRYKAEYIRFLIFAQASCDECTGQLEMLTELYPGMDDFKTLHESYVGLGKMINKYIQSVERR